jgi:hypothetical protein
MTTHQLGFTTSDPPATPVHRHPNARISRPLFAELAPNRHATARNKPNNRLSWPQNADHPEKQSQFKPNLGGPLSPISSLKSQISDTRGRPRALSSPAPNKANLPGPGIPLRRVYAVAYVELRPLAGAQKQSQSKPIRRLDSDESVPGFPNRPEACPGRIQQRLLPAAGLADSMTPRIRSGVLPHRRTRREDRQ